LLEQSTEKSQGARAAGVTSVMRVGVMVALTSSAQSNDECARHVVSLPVVLVVVHTSFVSSFPGFLTPHIPLLAIVLATSLVDNMMVGFGDVGLVGAIQSLGNARGGLVLSDGGRGALGAVA